MADLYRDFIQYLGYDVLERLSPASCEVYKVQRDGKPLIAKVGDQWDGGFAFRHVVREHEVLERAKDIESVPQELFFRTYQRGQPLALLVKEYLEGTMMYEVSRTLLQKSSLEAQVKVFHNGGMAGFDIKDINVLVNPEGKAGLIDYGSVYFRSEKSEEDFSVLKKGDLDSLQSLFKQFQNI